jgi:peptidoglycan/LPS O-acetylase OafA/YrhL
MQLAWIRLAAAFMVLYGHMFGIRGECEKLLGCPFGVRIEQLGVCIFFFISGFVVSQSWMRDAHVVGFLARRALRLLPGLAVSVVLTVVVIGPIATTLPLAAYFASPRTLDYLRWATLVQQSFLLPGVFETNHLHVVNGSLWSLPLEAMCYVAVATLGVLKMLKRYVGAGLLFIAIAAPGLLGSVYLMSVIACFVAGAFVFLAWGHVVAVPPRMPAIGDLSYSVSPQSG